MVTTDIFKLPKIFSEMLFTRIVELKGPNMVKVGSDHKLTRQVL
jgi:serine/threonine-protein phosphatase 2A regulatory subunit B''